MNDFSPLGTDLFGDVIRPKAQGPVAEKFLVAPFSVLSAREGEWQERKRSWIALGIKSEQGRNAPAYQTGGPGDLAATFKAREEAGKSGGVLFGSNTAADPSFYKKKREKEAELGRELTTEEFIADHYENDGAGIASSGTSVFDPVVCELAYRWFCPPGGQVVDPFAGGSVRGVVASLLGRRYWGCELRAEQVVANYEQGEAMCADAVANGELVWHTGDSMTELEHAPEADFLFSCPPYGDLEVYSDDPRDLSTMEYHTFIAAYKRIILRAVERMKPDSFACFVVGDFRDPKTGAYRGFVVDTINAFREVGLDFYNHAILVQSVGSLSMRVTKQFTASRKLGKNHQDILVFVKGDPRKAAEKCRAGDAA